MDKFLFNQIGLIGYTGKFGSQIAIELENQKLDLVLKANSTNWQTITIPKLIINASDNNAIEKVVNFCKDNLLPLVEVTSGITEDNLERLNKLATHVPVLIATNLTYGHFLQKLILNYLADIQNNSNTNFDITISERHTTNKKDKPSSTAKILAASWQAKTAYLPTINSIRAGLPVSDHAFNICFNGEEIMLTHSVRNFIAPVQALINASKWLINQNAGIYSMDDYYINLSKYKLNK